MPYSSCSAMRNARPRSRVQTYAARPYGVLFAARMIAASSVKPTIGATGPNVSSSRMRIPCVTPVNSVGSKKRPSFLRPPTIADAQLLDAVGHGIGERRLDLFVHIDAIRADARLPGVAEFRQHHLLHRSGNVGVVANDERRMAA